MTVGQDLNRRFRFIAIINKHSVAREEQPWVAPFVCLESGETPSNATSLSKYD